MDVLYLYQVKIDLDHMPKLRKLISSCITIRKNVYLFIPVQFSSTNIWWWLCVCVCEQVGGDKNKRGVVEAKLKVAINGFGRIGRNFLRCWHGRKDSPLDVIAINDTGGVKQASHLLKYDSTLGIFDADVKPVGNDAISVDGKVIQVVSNRNPANLPWK